jgi:hypothetical protein
MNRPKKGEAFPGQRIVVLPQSVVADARKHAVVSLRRNDQPRRKKEYGTG